MEPILSDKPVWTFRLEKERHVHARRAAVMDGTVYAGFSYEKRDSSQSKLFALDLETGSERWSYTVEHTANEPVTDGRGVTYWSSFEGTVHALDAGGALLWKAPGTTSNIFLPRLLGDDRLVVPEIAGGARYTWCLDRATGTTRWRFDHGGHTYTPFCHDDRVLHSSVRAGMNAARGSLDCLSADDGRSLWSVTVPEYVFNPVVLGGRVFVGSHRTVRAYSLDAGKLLVELQLETENCTQVLAPCSTPETLFVWRDSFGQGLDSIAAVDVATSRRFFAGETLTLRQRWKTGEHRGLCGAPMELSAGRLAYLTHDGVICVTDRATGANVAEVRLRTTASKTGGLRLAGDRLIAVHGRNVFCFAL